MPPVTRRPVLTCDARTTMYRKADSRYKPVAHPSSSRIFHNPASRKVWSGPPPEPVQQGRGASESIRRNIDGHRWYSKQRREEFFRLKQIGEELPQPLETKIRVLASDERLDEALLRDAKRKYGGKWGMMSIPERKAAVRGMASGTEEEQEQADPQICTQNEMQEILWRTGHIRELMSEEAKAQRRRYTSGAVPLRPLQERREEIDTEILQHHIKRKLQAIFEMCDVNGSGLLSQRELGRATELLRVKQYTLIELQVELKTRDIHFGITFETYMRLVFLRFAKTSKYEGVLRQLDEHSKDEQDTSVPVLKQWSEMRKGNKTKHVWPLPVVKGVVLPKIDLKQNTGARTARKKPKSQKKVGRKKNKGARTARV